MTSGSEENGSLWERLERGDQEALAELFSRHRDRLWRMVNFRLDRRLHGRVDADDVLQEAYLDALQRLPHYLQQKRNMSFFVWLRCIVSQTLVDIHRKHLGAKMRAADREVSLHNPLSNTTSVSMAAQLLGHLTSPSHAAMRHELSRQLEEALEKMNPIDREILALRHFEELTNSEVAEVLGIQQKAASIRYVRAIRRLKDILKDLPEFQDVAE